MVPNSSDIKKTPYHPIPRYFTTMSTPMQPFIILVILSFLVVLAASDSTQGHSTGGSCSGFTIVSNTTDTITQYKDIEDNDIFTTVALSNCLGNQDGNWAVRKSVWTVFISPPCWFISSSAMAGSLCIFYDIQDGGGPLVILAHCTTIFEFLCK